MKLFLSLLEAKFGGQADVQGVIQVLLLLLLLVCTTAAAADCVDCSSCPAQQAPCWQLQPPCSDLACFYHCLAPTVPPSRQALFRGQSGYLTVCQSCQQPSGALQLSADCACRTLCGSPSVSTALFAAACCCCKHRSSKPAVVAAYFAPAQHLELPSSPLPLCLPCCRLLCPLRQLLRGRCAGQGLPLPAWWVPACLLFLPARCLPCLPCRACLPERLRRRGTQDCVKEMLSWGVLFQSLSLTSCIFLSLTTQSPRYSHIADV